MRRAPALILALGLLAGPALAQTLASDADPDVPGVSDTPPEIPGADPTASQIDSDLDPALLALEGDPEYGAYLAAECTTCHQADGGNQGIPSIVGWPEEDFVIAMHAYKTRTRANPVMQMVAGRLGDAEIAALAAYFANVEE